MAFRGDVKALILGVLADGPVHGYGIGKRLRKLSDGELKLGEGQLYPALHNLEKSGLVDSEWDEENGKPQRRVYVLTESGRVELRKQVLAWEKFSKGIRAVLKVI